MENIKSKTHNIINKYSISLYLSNNFEYGKINPLIVNLKQTTRKRYIRIDRTTIWGNPYKINIDGDRYEVIFKYKKYLINEIRKGNIDIEKLSKLSGKYLACWCFPLSCHGNILSHAADWAYKHIYREILKY